jgi:hypothetical protein
VMAVDVSRLGGLPASLRSSRSRTSRSAAPSTRVPSGGVALRYRDVSLVVTVEEAGRLLCISRGSAYDLVRQGVIPSIRLVAVSSYLAADC